MRKGFAFVFGLLVVAIAACGTGDIGEACEEDGVVQGECTDGAVCGKNKAGQLVCLKQCSTQLECPTGTTCNGTGSSLKGCR